MSAASELTPAKKERSFLYTIARGLAFLLVHFFFPVTYHFLDRFSMQAPYILMANHKSLLDPFVIALGKKELSQGKLAGWVMRHMHMIPVDRHHSDLQAMRQCTKALREGHVLGIFPEGTRHLPDLMSEVETGTAVLALRANVPLLPVYINGKLRLFHRTHVYVGQPMDISDLSAQGFDSQAVQQLTLRIRDTFLQMRADAGK